MSAIFGIHYLDDRSVGQSGLGRLARVLADEQSDNDCFELKRMTQVLAHRGPDASGVWWKGQIGLGHRMLRTTPQSLNESQPFNDAGHSLVITADARLDNRKELLSELQSSSCLGTETDSELILAAYLRWGEDCPEKLLGDFAFAIWDAQKQLLFCARDHFGVKPFYYYFSRGKAFIFASEMKALFALPDVPCEVNQERVADHLAEVFTETESTFYRDVLRLSPGHSLTVRGGELVTRRYWELDRAKDVRMKSDAQYAEMFRSLFTEAVNCRLNSAFPIGAMLSGGLDSSSITCVARELLAQRGQQRLSTFSTVFDRVPKCDERPYIGAVLAQNNVKSHFIAGDERGPLQDLVEMHWHEDQAFFAPNFSMVWSIYRAAAQQGVRILLDGHDGDSTVSYGYKYLDELANSGRWWALTREIRGLGRLHGDPFWPAFRAYARHYRVNPMIAKSRTLRTIRRVWRGIRYRVVKREAKPSDSTGWRALVNPTFAAQTRLEERYKDFKNTLPSAARSEHESHYRKLTQPLQAFALEVHNSAASAFGIEPRYPFWDRRLVEFCLGLPPEQKLHHGWSRMIIRRAMAGILPAPVQWRISKTDFSPSLAYGLRAFELDHLNQLIIQNPGPLENYVNIATLRERYRRFLDSGSAPNSRDLFDIWKTVSLAQWLEMRGLGSRGRR